MKRLLAAATAAVMLAAPAAHAVSDFQLRSSYCGMAASIAGTATWDRLQGRSQQFAAARQTDFIEQVMNSGSDSYEFRKRLADEMAEAATFVIWLVYSLPLDRQLSDMVNVEGMKMAIEGMCLNGEILR